MWLISKGCLSIPKKRCCLDFTHRIISHYKNNQGNAWLIRNTREKIGATCYWFHWTSSTVLGVTSPLTWRSEHKIIEVIRGYICYLVDKNCAPYHEKAIASNHYMQRLHSLFMSSFHSKDDVELFQRYNMEEIYGQDYFNDDQFNIKVMS